MLFNGGFELVRDNAPAGWSKYGGTLASAEFGVYEGAWAAALISTTASTKWVHQVVPVTGGGWYRGTSMGTITSGKGELFIRMSWYASPDGSGSLIDQVDSNVVSGYEWAMLDTGAVRAPAGAKSVRFRLVLRPAEPATAMFDAAVLTMTEAPTPTPTPPPPTATSTAPLPDEPPGDRPPPSPPPTTARPHDGPGPVRIAEPDRGLTLRLSEVMADPPEEGPDAAFEWVEIVNTGTEPVSTAGWRLGDAQATDPIPETTLDPGAYVVVAGPEAAFATDVPVVRIADGRIGNGLNNAGDLVRLLGPDGTLVDSMSYGENTGAFDPPLPVAAPGETLGIRDPRGAGPDNWALTLRATPGEPNLFIEDPTETASPSVRGADDGPSPAARATADLGSNEVQEVDDGSIVPWLLLAAAGGAGATGAAMATRRIAPGILQRVRRNRGR